MARGKRVRGICHICGKHRDLSFEHVPPQSAFNNSNSVVVLKAVDWMRAGGPRIKPGAESNREAPVTTPCARSATTIPGAGMGLRTSNGPSRGCRRPTNVAGAHWSADASRYIP